MAARKPAAKKTTTTKKQATKPRAGAAAPAPSTRRLGVPKTYKLFIGGKFPRSESGRSFEVTGPRGAYLANASLASRKDARDAVQAARKAVKGWSGATAYNRGQVLYRIAEVLDGRRAQFQDELEASGRTAAAAAAEVDAAVATWIFYAGFCDKYAQVLGAANPVGAPYFNFSLPEPQGMVVTIAPQDAGAALVGLAATLAPAMASGNAVVVVASERNPLTSISFAEVLATSDVPAGVVNVLTGTVAELAPGLAAHMDVNGLDLAGVQDPDLARDLEVAAAENLKRVARARALDLAGSGSLEEISRWIELKTVWHPIGV